MPSSFEAQTTKLFLLAWPSRNRLDVNACLVFAKPLVPPSRLTRTTSSSFVYVLLLSNAPQGSSVTPSELLGSLSSSLLIFVFHRHWFIGMNLSPDLHYIRRPPHHRIMHLHITSHETSNSYNIVSHPSFRIDHH